jgi:ATP-dependent helicase YprA (DUF1998 family)
MPHHGDDDLASSPTDILIRARESATNSRFYDHVATRRSIEQKFQAVFDGKPPYAWQTDVTEALLLGLDCIVVAGTGSGKTMPFGMPLLLEETKDKMIVVISPLNELEAEQVSKLFYFGMFRAGQTLEFVQVPQNQNWNLNPQ